MDIASGKVIANCKTRHRHQEFPQFLRDIEANVPKDLDIHLVLDNYATHKHPKVRRWISARRPRYHIPYTPTYSSWLNRVEIGFNNITQKAIRRGSPSIAGLSPKRIRRLPWAYAIFLLAFLNHEVKYEFNRLDSYPQIAWRGSQSFS